MREVKINAVAGVSFDISKGEFAIIVVSSRVKKSTVLNLLDRICISTSGT